MRSQIPMSDIFLYCIAIAAFLIYVPFLLVAYARVQLGKEALATPRAIVDKLPPYAQRATWAHQNAFEAFMLFAAAALMAYVTGVNSSVGVGAAIAFLVARLLHSVFYILNIPLARGLMFALGSLCIATLFVQSLLQASIN
ncbi:MAPEG family protein [Planktothrix sp. FACHB-1355]|uniref:MAPEG family protein n=1 Tax=Aerosakkonema funiforme FACHB-1375 TaxID=2949571 RepID=A0A926ZJL2_9CYAN|nr:MAPEG family protein [Aerosakkonema funiforme FACHB-1375]MBD3558037.1 MAPEG family protein [Planktothrix sp. FACHB-1355]